MTEQQLQRFMQKVVVADNGCWEWQGYRHPRTGHAVVNAGGRPTGAHRVAYEHFRGPIPDGMHAHHTCENPACVNPHHIKTLTPSGHATTHVGLRKFCRNGHPITPENRGPAPGGYTRCRVCHRENERQLRQRKREP